MRYYAHSANSIGHCQLVSCHLCGVAEKASEFAARLRMTDEAYAAGLLHDIGKYSDSFMRRLQGKESGLDHWSPGAFIALSRVHSVAAALAIQGHHIGLGKADRDAFQAMRLDRLEQQHPLGLTLTEADPNTLLGRFTADGFSLPNVNAPTIMCPPNDVPDMLDVRMLYSALVDADFLDTEQHMKEGKENWARPEGLSLNPEEAFKTLTQHIGELAASAKASGDVKTLRADLFEACVNAAAAPVGLFTLTAPTGAGKTLSMLAFALRHAIACNLRRVVVVIPYLSIIEQTADVYKRLFRDVLGEHYVLEHHSLTETKGTKSDEDPARLLSQNWDAPLVITTSVQMLESLFSNRPSACRKLHNLAGSIILFDEVQTLPPDLAAVTLAALAHLARRYGSSVVFSTATQPAFKKLDSEVQKLSGSRVGWEPVEIVPSSLNLFDRARRTRVSWPEPGSRTTWQELAEELENRERAICVVNLKRHAQDLFGLLKDRARQPVYHLSTSMCPGHRSAVLSTVKTLLKEKQPCILVSTQCVEAGVDISSPYVYRAFADLTSVAQAAGRCNRDGNDTIGEVYVFHPEEKKYPGGEYEQAANITEQMLNDIGRDAMDIHNPKLYEDYYTRLYSLAKQHESKRGAELVAAVTSVDFESVAAKYRIICQDTINVLVPYQQMIDEFEALAEEVRSDGLTGHWIRKARTLAVSLYRPKPNAPVAGLLEAVPIKRGGYSDDWFIYTFPGHYSADCGLVLPDALALLAV